MFSKNSSYNLIICCSSALVFSDVTHFHFFLSFSKTFRGTIIQVTSGPANPVSVKIISSQELLLGRGLYYICWRNCTSEVILGRHCAEGILIPFSQKIQVDYEEKIRKEMS